MSFISRRKFLLAGIACGLSWLAIPWRSITKDASLKEAPVKIFKRKDLYRQHHLVG